jgi:hypothetical protein
LSDKLPNIEASPTSGGPGSLPTGTASSTTIVSERVSPIVFKRILKRFDLIALTTALIYYVANSSGLVAFGPYIIGLAVISMLVWYVPSALATAELGLLLRGVCGIYIWA